MNEDMQIVYILGFKRSSDREEGFLAEANEQHESITGALKAAAPKWEFAKGLRENIGHNVHV